MLSHSFFARLWTFIHYIVWQNSLSHLITLRQYKANHHDFGMENWFIYQKNKKTKIGARFQNNFTHIECVQMAKLGVVWEWRILREKKTIANTSGQWFQFSAYSKSSQEVIKPWYEQKTTNNSMKLKKKITKFDSTKRLIF